MQLKHLTDYQLSGKRVMLRADMNVPLKDGIIANEERIDRTLPTIKHILREGGKLILLSHLGRPKETNEVQEEFSLKPVVNYLEEKLSRKIYLKDYLDEVKESNEEFIMLENIRFFKGEKNKKDSLELKGLPKEMSKSLTARYEVKINDLSDQIRRIRGSIEELEFRFIQGNERLDALNNYLTSSPSSSGNQLLRDPALQGALNDTLSTSEELEDLPIDQTQGYTTQKLGSLQIVQPNEDDMNVVNLSEPKSQMQQLPQENNLSSEDQFSVEGKTPKQHYELAISFIWKKDFDSAAKLLKNFLERYPSNDLAGNAKYWLGETHYAQKSYSQAAVIFAEGFQTYPSSKKAPDILLKLAMSLAQLEKKGEACKTITILEKKFPDSPPHILERVVEEKSRNSC